MHRFFAQGAPEIGGAARLDEAEARHAEKVLRLTPGAQIEVTVSGARFSAEYRGGAAVSLRAALPDNEAPVGVTLFMGVPKADKLEWIVQKATELGASAVAPVRMARSVAVWDDRDCEKRVERLRRIALEASKQCGRARPPCVSAPRALEAALRAFDGELLLMPWEMAAGRAIADECRAAGSARRIGVLIGPEGGIAADEARRAEAFGARAVTLGPRILRAETAAVAALTLVMGLWGDMR
jgi:16S rRNA (uracil1498-N3)-methyltransferase